MPTARAAAANSTTRSRQVPVLRPSVTSGGCGGPASRTSWPNPSKSLRLSVAGTVALVALADLGGDGLRGHGFALVAEVAHAAADALLGIGVQEDFDIRVREHYGADVAAFHDDTGARAQSALLLDQGAAHARNRGYHGGLLAPFDRADSSRDILAIEQ